jgi:hypothetical protein
VGLEGGGFTEWQTVPTATVLSVSLQLPAGATNEVLVAFSSTVNPCPGSPLGPDGVLVDDLSAQ